MTDLNRRTVLRGVAITGAIGTVGPLLAACGSDEPDTEAGSSDSSSAPESSAPESPTDSPSGGGQEAFATTSDIPVGGGRVFAEQEVVVTQPTEGEFLAFTAVCTHQGCTVGEVADGTINCPCHGSMFSINDGSVAGGPAQEPLAEQAITVDGQNITLA